MLECGLISMALRYKDTDTTTVQFKLLGLLRMVVDKQGEETLTISIIYYISLMHTYVYDICLQVC